MNNVGGPNGYNPRIDYQQRLGQSIRSTQDCKMQEEPAVYAQFVSNSLEHAGQLLDPKSPELAYIKMARSVAGEIKSNPQALVRFWENAIHTAQAGIHTTAGVALARTAKAVASSFPDVAGTVNQKAVAQIHFGAERFETNASARQGTRNYYDQLNHNPDLGDAAKNALAQKTVDDIAALTEWKFAGQ